MKEKKDLPPAEMAEAIYKTVMSWTPRTLNDFQFANFKMQQAIYLQLVALTDLMKRR